MTHNYVYIIHNIIFLIFSRIVDQVRTSLRSTSATACRSSTYRVPTTCYFTASHRNTTTRCLIWVILWVRRVCYMLFMSSLIKMWSVHMRDQYVHCCLWLCANTTMLPVIMCA